jgi:hypothetical protein
MMEIGRAFRPEHKNMIMRPLKDELVLYDPETKKAFCLNRVASEVWVLCDGKTTVEEIVEHFKKLDKPEIGRNVIHLSLRKLQRSGLLKNGSQGIEQLTFRSRRALIKKLGLAAAMTLPVITSIVVPTPSEAASPCRHSFQPCPRGNTQCCSGLCVGGFCVGG